MATDSTPCSIASKRIENDNSVRKNGQKRESILLDLQTLEQTPSLPPGSFLSSGIVRTGSFGPQTFAWDAARKLATLILRSTRTKLQL